MNKSDLINAVAAEANITKAEAKKSIEAFMKAVSQALKAGEKISLIGFGTFYVQERASRIGINPSTKESITIPAKKIIKFKPGIELNSSFE